MSDDNSYHSMDSAPKDGTRVLLLYPPCTVFPQGGTIEGAMHQCDVSPVFNDWVVITGTMPLVQPVGWRKL